MNREVTMPGEWEFHGEIEWAKRIKHDDVNALINAHVMGGSRGGGGKNYLGDGGWGGGG